MAERMQVLALAHHHPMEWRPKGHYTIGWSDANAFEPAEITWCYCEHDLRISRFEEGSFAINPELGACISEDATRGGSLGIAGRSSVTRAAFWDRKDDDALAAPFDHAQNAGAESLTKRQPLPVRSRVPNMARLPRTVIIVLRCFAAIGYTSVFAPTPAAPASVILTHAPPVLGERRHRGWRRPAKQDERVCCGGE